MAKDNKRRRLPRPYPQFPLEEIERIPKIIHSARKGNEMDSKELAHAMSKTNKSSEYIMMINAAKSYGLVTGSYNTKISILPLAEKILSPTNQEERREGLAEAALKPPTFRTLVDLIAEKKLPEDHYVKNILEREIGIHHDLTDECLGIFKANSKYSKIFDTKENTHKSTHNEDLVEGKRQEEKQILIYMKNVKLKNEKIEKILDLLGVKYLKIKESEIEHNELGDEIKKKMKECNSAIIEKDENEMTHQIIGAAAILYDKKILLLTENELEEQEFIQNLIAKNIIQISQN